MLVGELTELVMLPNEPEVTLPFGTAKLDWFSKLNALADLERRAFVIGIRLGHLAATVWNESRARESCFGGMLPKIRLHVRIGRGRRGSPERRRGEAARIDVRAVLTEQARIQQIRQNRPPYVAESRPGSGCWSPENGRPLYAYSLVPIVHPPSAAFSVRPWSFGEFQDDVARDVVARVEIGVAVAKLRSNGL